MLTPTRSPECAPPANALTMGRVPGSAGKVRLCDVSYSVDTRVSGTTSSKVTVRVAAPAAPARAATASRVSTEIRPANVS